MEVSLSHGVQWERKFATQANSSIMWLFSLAWIGRLLSTFQQRNDVEALRIAVVAIEELLEIFVWTRQPIVYRENSKCRSFGGDQGQGID